jgi:death-on-curing protein
MINIRYLTLKEVIAINASIILRYSPGEQIGILNNSLLESAVYRPQQSAFGEDAYPTIMEKSAAIFESLGQNHAFQNANKRTAFMALVVFLSNNNYEFEMESKRAENFTVDMVNHEYTFEKLVSIINEHSNKIQS